MALEVWGILIDASLVFSLLWIYPKSFFSCGTSTSDVDLDFLVCTCLGLSSGAIVVFD